MKKLTDRQQRLAMLYEMGHISVRDISWSDIAGQFETPTIYVVYHYNRRNITRELVKLMERGVIQLKELTHGKTK